MRKFWLFSSFVKINIRQAVYVLRRLSNELTFMFLYRRQFGNMLVLAATYGSWLGRLIHKEKLVALLKRTIRHLSPLCQLSPALSYDHQILTNVLKNVQGDFATSKARVESPMT